MCVRQVPGHLSYTQSLGCKTEQTFHFSVPVSVQGDSSGLFGAVSLGPNASVQTLRCRRIACVCGGGPKLSSDPAAWLRPTLRAHMSCTSHKGPLMCLQHGRTDQHSKRSLRPLHQQFAISRADPKSARPHRAQSSRELHRAGFKCSLSPSVSLLTCKTGRCAVFGMDSVIGGP